MDQTVITAYILASEKSQRMGTDKGFLEWNERTFIAISIDAITPW